MKTKALICGFVFAYMCMQKAILSLTRLMFLHAVTSIKSLLPETEVSRYLQASLCVPVHLKTDMLMTLIARSGTQVGTPIFFL